MKLIKTIAELQSQIKEVKREGKTIGLVPTMGALHEGHASLIRAAHEENDFVIVSDFVNPTQFSPNEDLDAYPRTLVQDCEVAETMGADVVFTPSPQEMYPNPDMTWVEVTGSITKVLCGKSRPIHFRGVATVVSKLFHLAQPDRAYFGQKDAQQAEVLKRMVQDLFFPLEIRVMPIIREADGLAKSSRNVYLSDKERAAALILSKALQTASLTFAKGEKNSKKLIEMVSSMIQSEPMSQIDYVEMYQRNGLTEAEETITQPHLLAVAVRFGNTRLIDNVVLGEKE